MSTSPPRKRQKSSPSGLSDRPPETAEAPLLQPPPPLAPKTTLDTIPPPLSSPSNPRKRRASRSPAATSSPLGPAGSHAEGGNAVSIPSLLTGGSEGSAKKRGRTNTPWTAAEEQRLKQMRDAGNSWGEIAKAFPARTEGSVKKHWYKDMHYAEFAEDETVALREAIKEYEANKWKVIGQKVGKPAKACEQYAKEHFRSI